MAISKGQASVESNSYKRYIGVAPCYVEAVNPNKAEMEKIYGSSLENDPVYVGEVTVDETKVPNVRITFITVPDKEKVGAEIPPISVSMFIQNRYRYNKDKTKVQVIDKYGRTAWVTIEQAKAHEIPMYANGPANLDKDYRPAYVGEEDLTNFLIAYLNIPAPMKYDSVKKTWYMVDNPSESECRLDHINEFFNGNFSELKEAISLQPSNKVKILFGVRTGDDGKQYQSAFTQMFLRNSVGNYDRLNKALQEKKQAGAYSTTEFEVRDLTEYNVKPTEFKQEEASELPFDVPF